MPMAHPVTFKGSRLARWILKAFGWKLAFDGFPTLQGVAIVYPHTSNWDFPVGILAKWALGIPANFWGKDSLFKFPVMGAWMRWIGGVPIDRSSPKGVVAEMVQVFEQHKRDGRLLWLAWVAHAVALLSLLIGPVRFGFAPAISVTAWLVVTAYMIESQFFNLLYRMPVQFIMA